MFEIHLEHIRCFAEKQTVPIRPITLLVGENSTGKSSLLAMVSCLFNGQFPQLLALNEPPYYLGNFDSLATYKGGKNGKHLTFSIGFTVGIPENPINQEVFATYRNDHEIPVLERLNAVRGSYELDIKIRESKFFGKLISSGPGNSREIPIAGYLSPDELRQRNFYISIFSYFLAELGKSESLSLGNDTRTGWNDLPSILEVGTSPISSCYSFAPIRSKPRRTYDDFQEQYSPEGDHIPYLLDRLLGQNPDSPESQHLHDVLASFGKDSGLFRKIEIKKLGRRPSEPFQVRVNTNGASFNLVDVGYGISQVLPLIVQSVLKTRNQMMLIQQPEVHLHPRAQAALGTFFSKLAADGKRYFLIETHSDYLLDRVRQEVARGTIAAEDVIILFFDKPKQEATIYPIRVDSMGNIEDPPEHYREFFVREELNLLSRGASHVLDR